MTSPKTLPAIGDTLDCGHKCEPARSTFRPGNYGTDQNGRTVCDNCATDEACRIVSSATPGTRFGGYLSADGRNVTTWPGGVIMNRVQRGADHPFSARTLNRETGKYEAERFYVTAWDYNGNRWTGTAGRGMCANLKRCK